MSLRNRLVLPIVISAIAALAGCGSNTPGSTPPPSGSFSIKNLNGTYVFSVVGSDSAGNFEAMTGTIVADGSGNLTGGTFDLNNPNGTGFVPVDVGSNSRYTVTADGRGTATINTASSGTFGFDFVLSSSQGGQITEFDSAGSGSGTLDLQSNVSQSDIAGSYAFNFSGTSGIGSVLCGVSGNSPFVIPLANVGAFTLDASGNITAGVEDFNNNCSSTNATNLPITGGSVNLGTVPGTATITSTAGTFHYDVYPVSATDLKFIEIDATTVTAGNAFTQTTSIPSGNNVFTLAGFDTVAGGPFTAAGVLDTDGNGNLQTDSVEDINDSGTATEVSSGITGTYTALTSGRSVLTMSGFVNGGGGLGCTNCQFVVYPSSGGLQMMEIDNGGSTNGVAYAQTATSLASSQGYGMNLTGANFSASAEEDDIAEFTNNNGTFTGIIDFNDQGSTLSPNQKFSSTYQADSTVSGRGMVTAGSNSYDFVTYVVDSSTIVALPVDSNFVGLGSFALQNSSAKSNAAVSHLAVLKVKPGAKSCLKHR